MIFYPKESGISHDILTDMITDRLADQDGPEIDEDHIRAMLLSLPSVRLQTFADEWYYWTTMMGDLPDTAPIKQEKLLQTLAAEIGIHYTVDE